MEKEILNINIEEFGYYCSEGCCLDSGTKVTVNGVLLPFQNEDTETIIKQILEHLGYTVNITSSENYQQITHI